MKAPRHALMLALAVLAAAQPCRAGDDVVAINWFPKAADIGAAITRPVFLASNNSLTEAACNGPTTSCAFPDPWLPTSQLMAKAALPGYSLSSPLKIAIKSYGGVEPRIYFIPASPLLQLNSDVTALVAAAAATRRRKLQVATTANAFVITTPGSWSFTVKHDGASPAVTGTRVGNAGVVTIPADSEGEACATIAVTISGFTINNLPPGGLINPVTTQKVCWYRFNEQARAKVAFDPASTCRTGTVSMDVSNVYPLAQNLTQNGSNVVVGGEPQLLFVPVLHVWGALNKTLDGTTLTELQYDEQNQPVNYINKYILLPATLKPTDKLSFELDDGKLLTGELEQGYYRLSAKVSLISRFPQLVDLQGKAAIAQTDVTDVQGYTEYASLVVINGSDDAVAMQALQLNTTAVSISSISSNKIGREIVDGENVTFSWQFVGAGSQRCYHDEVLLPGACTSPLTVPAKPVSGGSSVSHVFRVEFADVCGNLKNATYMYTQSGVTALSKIDYIPVTAAVLTIAAGGSPSGMTRAATRSSAAGLAPGSLPLAANLLAGLASILLIMAL